MAQQTVVNRSETIVVQGRTYSIDELSEFGFKAHSLTLDPDSDKTAATLRIGPTEVPVAFRERKRSGDASTCSFVGLSLDNQQGIRRYLTKKSRLTSGDDLEERTYDELAAGVVTSKPESNQQKPAAVDSNFAKTLALMLMLFVMAALALLAFAFLKSRSSLAVGNSALVGNFLPINAKVPGEIVTVQVQEGDFVNKGDLLVRLANPEMEVAIQTYSAQIITAETRVQALTKQRASFQTKLDIAQKKLGLDLEVARSQEKAAEKSRQVAEAVVEQYKPYVKSGAVTQLEFNAATNELLAAESQLMAASNLKRQIEFSRDSASDKVLILGDRFDDEAARVETDLEIAKAELRELQQLQELTSQQIKQLEIVAPRDGQIYAMYHQPGEYLKIADEIVALSHHGNVWAAGQVTASQASRVRPGQPVKVTIPSIDKTMQGVVTAVGHRAMYSRGHYSSEFRGTTATDVPIKVAIADLPKDIPSGIRLDLSISTGYGLKWLDDLTGFELKPIGSKQRQLPDPNVSQVAVD